MSNWQIISTYTYPHEAHMAKTYLESEGLNVVIQDELTAQVNNFYSNAIGGVKLLIRESDFENARQLLQKGGFIQTEAKNEVELIEIEEQTNYACCPFCESEHIGKKKHPNFISVILFFILGALLPIFKKTSVCFDCDKHWKYIKG